MLEDIFRRPSAFEPSTAADLWTDDHVSRRMLAFHLDGATGLASRTTAFIEASADWIARRFGLEPGRHVADLGCGPGLYTERFAATGAHVTGIDFSERSIRHARASAERRGLDVDYVVANYLEHETEARFDLVTLIMCDYCALHPGQRSALLRKVRSWLRPGGALLFDAYTLHAFDKRREASRCEADLMDGFWAAGPYYGFHHTFLYEAEKAVLDQYTIVEASRTRVVRNWLQYVSPDALVRELAGAGFAVVEWLGDVGGSPHDPGRDEFAVVAAAGG